MPAQILVLAYQILYHLSYLSGPESFLHKEACLWDSVTATANRLRQWALIESASHSLNTHGSV